MKVDSINSNNLNLLEKTVARENHSQTIDYCSEKDVELHLSNEGLEALRKSTQALMPEETSIELHKMTATDTNEIEFEHYMAMRQLSANKYEQIKKDFDRNYTVEDIMKTMMDTYETLYQKIIEAHKNGDREVNYSLTGKQTITLEQDLDGLNKAFDRSVGDLQSYIYCEQTNKQALIELKKRRNQFLSAQSIEYETKLYYMDDDYRETVKSIMQTARDNFLKMIKSSNYQQGMGLTNLVKLMNSNAKFIEGTKKLFSSPSDQK